MSKENSEKQPGTMESKAVSQKGIESHKVAAKHSEDAAKHHTQAAKHYEAGDLTEVKKSTT